MNEEEQSNFINKLRFDINEGENKLEFFIEKWKQFDVIDKESLGMPLIGMCNKEMKADNYYSKTFFIFQNIVRYITDNEEYKSDIKKFNLANSVKAIEIVKIFLTLKGRQLITNTNEDTATLICTIFDFNYKTVLSYLKKPQSLEQVKDLLK